MPEFAATVSATIEPTKATVIAIFNDAKKYGIALGRPTFIITWRRVAPSALRTSRNSGSTVAIPVATLTRMGKNESKKAVITAGTVPIPNHMTSTGITATFGTELNAISAG